MRDEGSDIDRSVQLRSAGEAGRSSPLREPWPGLGGARKSSASARGLIALAIAGGVLLAIGALAAMVLMVVRIGRESTKEVVVTGQRDPALLRAESAEVFGNYDAAAWERGELGGVSKSEREEITALFELVEKCVADGDQAKFQALVDADRMLKRVDLTGGMAGWSYFDKRSWRSQLKSSADGESYWAQITVTGIVTPSDDPDTRIVYAYGDDATSSDPTECRFWIARDGDSWKLYDWARLDLGLAESQVWGLYAKYANSKLIEGCERWGELLSEADEATGRGDVAGAKEKLRMAESQFMPPEFQGFYLVLTGYRWEGLNELAEAERCYKALREPADTPGAYFGLLRCNLWDNPSEALRYAQQYEAEVGPSPALLEVKAELLERLDRKQESVAEWGRLLRIKPDHVYAASEYVASLPIDDESEFAAALDQLNEPLKLVASTAPVVAYQDYERLLLLADYVNRKSPESAGACYVTGLTQFYNGRYAEAATLYRSAFEKETDEETRKSYVNAYVEAMVEDGKVVEALKNVPDAKAEFAALYESYDEGDIALTDDEFRQVVALHRELYPDDVTGMYREASEAIEAERFEDAERAARAAMEAAGTSEDDTEYYHEECESLLTAALFKQGRWKEAYETVGERPKQFAAIARLAADDKKWDLVREIVESHRATNADDPKLHGVEGELAAHEKRWDDAVRDLRLGLQGLTGYEAWGLNRLLTEAYVDSGRWLDHFRSSSDQGETFERLADRFIAEQDWDALDKLITEYQRNVPDDIRIAWQQAEVAWHRKDYEAYAELAQKLLNAEDESIKGYEREVMKGRLTSALLRSGRIAWARQQAIAEQRDEKDATMLAIVNAAEGNLAEASRLALLEARKQESASMFYSHDDVGSKFLRDEFSVLHEEFPVDVLHDATSTLAVFVFDKPQRLELDDLYVAMKELEIEIGPAAMPLDAKQGSSDAYTLQQGDAMVWLAAGEGPFKERWSLAPKSGAFADAFNSGSGWLAVGIAAFATPDRERVEKTARRLGARLAGKGAVAICIHGPMTWQFAAFPASAELIDEWQKTGRVREFKDEAVAVQTDVNDRMAADREFERRLYELARLFEGSQNGRLEVVSYASANPHLDPLRLKVEKVRRRYGSLVFEGVLVNDCVLVPELRNGLSIQTDLDSIQEAQFGGEEPVRRE